MSIRPGPPAPRRHRQPAATALPHSPGWSLPPSGPNLGGESPSSREVPLRWSSGGSGLHRDRQSPRPRGWALGSPSAPRRSGDGPGDREKPRAPGGGEGNGVGLGGLGRGRVERVGPFPPPPIQRVGFASGPFPPFPPPPPEKKKVWGFSAERPGARPPCFGGLFREERSGGGGEREKRRRRRRRGTPLSG